MLAAQGFTRGGGGGASDACLLDSIDCLWRLVVHCTSAGCLWLYVAAARPQLPLLVRLTALCDHVSGD